MTSELKTRMNYTTSTGMKVVFPETKAGLIKIEGQTFSNLQELLDNSGTFRVNDGMLQTLDKATGEWRDVIVDDGLEHPPLDNVLPNATGLEAVANGRKVTVKWTDPKDVTVQTNDEVTVLTKWLGTKLVYKEGSEPGGPLDGTLVIDSTERDQFSTEGIAVTDLNPNVTYYFKLFPYDDKGRYVIDSANAVSITTTTFFDTEGTPGSTETIAGDETAGFFGEVPNEEFITPVNLASTIGLTSGVSYNEGTPWLKFVLDGKILFTTKNPIRYNLSWDDINKIGAVYGTKLVRVDGKYYRVRLFKGALTDPYSNNSTDRGAKGSEWNRLMLPIHEQAKDNSWAFPDYVEDTIPNWNIGYSDEDLLTHESNGNGSYTMCQETPSEDSSSRLLRGYIGVSFSGIGTRFSASALRGWRPVLELIPDEEVADNSGSPGSPLLVAGDNRAGFFGEVTNTDLITPVDLADTIGLTAGTSFNEDTPWLKFILDGKVLFAAKKPIRYGISWDLINAVGAAYGTNIIKLNDNYYKVRLFKGALTDPYSSSTSDRGAKGSEWNRLMLPIHIQAKDKSWAYPQYVEDNVPDWGIGYTDADLLTNSDYGDGAHTWCQETPSEDSSCRTIRGYVGVSHSGYNTSSSTLANWGWRPVLELIPEEELDDKSRAPGSPLLLAGDTSAGFFGEVANPDLVTPYNLASTIGLTEGTTYNEDTPWLKFMLDGKILFTTKKPIRHTLTWDQINEVGAVYGNKIIKLQEKYYRLRLIKGALTDPSNNSDVDRGAIGSEWNRLMLPIHIQAKDKSWKYPSYVEDNVPDWNIGYTDEDLLTSISVGSGSYTWCQEKPSSEPDSRVIRGYAGVSYSTWYSSSFANSSYGWRPVLELVPDEEVVDKSGSPGLPILKAGDETTGFFGEVENSELITPKALSNTIGLDAGTLYNEDTPWLKFMIDGKVIFAAKKPFRYNLTWDAINAVDAVYGNKLIPIGDNYYRVRLFKGAVSDPYLVTAADRGAIGSEWNRLMLPIHIQAKDKSWTYPAYVEDNVPDWGIGYTDEDLLTHYSYGNGNYTWCQETPSGKSGFRTVRGYYGTTHTYYGASSEAMERFGWRPVLELVPNDEVVDKSGSPGLPILKAGDTTAGFFGEVENSELITPLSLADTLGLTAGTSFNEDTPWLKFVLDGTILFTTKKPIRHSISWDDINAIGAAYGTKTVQLSGKTYRVRLFKGALTDPYQNNASDVGAKGSEWNRLMLPIHIQSKDKSWAYPAYVEDDLPHWGIGYTDEDLLTESTYGNGSYTWCQETPSDSTSRRVARGCFGVSYSHYHETSSALTSRGWRPVLELVPDEEVDNSGSPGFKVPIAGDSKAGFFGEVSNDQFITPTALADTIGLYDGTSYNEDTPWLKFFLDGKVLFTTKKAIRYNIAWDSINAADVVYGNKVIKIKDNYYKVRLFKGAKSDPYSVNSTDKGAKGSEWNKLMLPIHIQAKDGSWAYPQYVEDNVPDWGVGYNDEDLLTHYNYGNGAYTWCQETPSENTANRSYRGGDGGTSAGYGTSYGTGNGRGWRPVLELVPKEEVDKSGSPGPMALKAGDKSAGFFGEVENSELITPLTLADTIGLSDGISFNEDTPWLKFILDGRVLFTTKKNIRYKLSWDRINAVNAVYGTNIIKIKDNYYRLRLFRGAVSDPYNFNNSDRGAKGSEWNRLMLPIHIQAKDKSWKYPAYVEDNVPDWNIGYNDEDLSANREYSTVGTYTICLDSTLTSNCAFRGYFGISYTSIAAKSTVSDQYAWRPVLELIPEEEFDKSGSPGPIAIKAGDTKAGFFGEVENSELISPVELASTIGLTEGTSFNEDTPWLKFFLDGKVLFTTKKPIRHSVSWDQINSTGAVYGTNIIKIQENYYRVRLFKGALTDPYSYNTSDKNAKGSEWNRLMLPIHIQAKDKSWAYPAYIENDIPNWNIGYTDEDLLTHKDYGSGSYIWCQETPSEYPAGRSGRGGAGVSGTVYGSASGADKSWGWRPVLELISEEELNDISRSPGSPILKAGDNTTGFFGEVPNTELITPVNLADTIGLTAGTSFNEDTPWLKFILDGRVLFTTKKPVRHTLTWDSINESNAVYGTNTIKIKDNYYKVRLFKGALADPSDGADTGSGAKGSEWNRLMLPIHAQAKDQSWDYPAYVEDSIPNWNIGYTDTDLYTNKTVGDGTYSWCQETSSTVSTYRVVRGGTGDSFSGWGTASYSDNLLGWRPVLELIPKEEIDNSGSPGSPTLKAGDNTAGFFGEVSNSELITPVELASTIGLTAGTSYNEDTPWLKFLLDGKVLFTTKKPIRYNVSWDNINAVGAVYGTNIIKLQEKYYKVRLFKGALTDPYLANATDMGVKGSEWNRLMLPIHTQAKDKSWKYPAYVEDNIPDWGIGYTDTDLSTSTSVGSGSYTLCQETSSDSASYRIVRGGLGVSHSGGSVASGASDGRGWRPVLELISEEELDDISRSPGSPVLKAGDTTTGFFGEVPNSELITPTALASTIGLTEGTSYNEDTPWLKFMLDGRVIFTTKKPIRHSISWDSINAIGAAYGTKTIQINNKHFKVRLFKGALTDPYSYNASDRGAKGSEWNRLMLPIHTQAKDKSWKYPAFVEYNVPDWGIGYTDADLLTDGNSGNGAYTWCQETPSEDTSNRLIRGYYGATNTNYIASSVANEHRGWRPVLELIPDEEISDNSGSPGSLTLKAGDETAGFFGEVPNAQLITPVNLASTIGLTEGTSFNEDTPWLKFSLDGKILFTTKKPIRHSISWDSINAIGAAYGTKTIQIDDKYFKVRLFKGALTDPYSSSASDRGAKGSEWNRLMLPIHVQSKDKSWAYPAYVEDSVPNWGIGYTDADLLTHDNFGDGSYTWCQETPSEDTSNRSIHGYSGVSFSSYVVSSSKSENGGWRPVLELIPDSELDNSGSPGSTSLKAGDKTAGFFGEVENSEFITPATLASTIGLSAGTSYNEDTPWLKFILDGKILFTTKKPIRHSISWDAINTADAVYGKKIITVGDKYYRIRLFKGASSDPYSSSAADQGAKGSEWNRLMLPINIQATDKSWKYPAYVEDNVPNWGIGYTDADLLTGNAHGNGSYTWCQEAPSENSSTRVGRGHDGVSSSNYGTSSNTSTARGWRPILELVPEEEIDNDLKDTTGSPGPSVLKAGDKTAGFFGEVPNSELITPVNLASTIGLSAGTSYNTDTPWLKFSLDGKILFTTKKPIRYGLSWNSINTVGAAKGTKTIQVSGKTYKVRLLKGTLTDPYSINATDKRAKGSEWNRLMLPIHIQAKDKSWAYPAYVEDNVPNWNIGYTDADLLTNYNYGSGAYQWCQETPSEYPSFRLIRGGTNGVSNSGNAESSNTGANYGWRPVLELVE